MNDKTGPDTTFNGIPGPTSYLRDQAHRCMRLARNCSDRATSHALEAMGIEFLEKAAEVEKMHSVPSAQTNGAG